MIGSGPSPGVREAGAPVLGDRLAVPLLWFLLTLAVGAALSGYESFFLRDDFLNYYLGPYAEITRAYQAGELPLLTLTSWQAGALAAEYQLGVFSPVLGVLRPLLFGLDLPLPHVAAALVWIHVLVLASGAYVLARSRRLPPELALMVALVSSLNGWMVIWGVNWFSALAGFAWLPWFWWAIEKAIAGGGRLRHVAAAGFFSLLIFTAALPWICLMAFFVAAGAAGRLRIAGRPLVEALPAAWSLAVGLGLSAPAWLMLLEYTPSTLRGQATHPLLFQTDFTVSFKAWFGTLLPTLKAPWNVPWLPPGDTPSLVMHTGLAPVVLLAAAGFVLRSKLVRELEYDFFLLAILFLLATLPGLGMLRWPFRWLPLLFLQLSLIAGTAATMLRASPRPRPAYGKVAFLSIAAVAAWAALVDGDRGPRTLWLAAGLLAVASCWWGIESLPRLRRLDRHLPWLVVLATTFLVFGPELDRIYRHRRVVEPRATPAFDPSVTYLALYTLKDMGERPLRLSGQRYFPANEFMHEGLRFVNGHSPLGPAGTTSTFGFTYIGSLTEKNLHPGGDRPLGPLLERMAVDGLVLWPGSRDLRDVPFEDFEKHASLRPGIDVYHRRGERSARAQIVRQAKLVDWRDEVFQTGRSALPIVEIPGRRLRDPQTVAFGEAEITRIEEGRHRMQVTVDARGTDSAVLVSFARQWFPGYRVTVDGEAAPLRRLDFMMPAVEVPGGGVRRVELVYRPTSFVAGCALTALTLAGLFLRAALGPRRRSR